MSSVRTIALAFFLVVGTRYVSAGPDRFTKPNPDNPDSCPASLCKAAAKRDEGKIRRAIEIGTPNICNCTCDPDPVPVTNKTLLHLTTIYDEAVAFANLLLDTPPNCSVNALDATKNTPLHEAAASCFPPMAYVRPPSGFALRNEDCRVQVFMEADAEVELENDDGYTPMCVAASTDDPNCAGVVIHLVEYGADICKKCNGTLPYDLAVNKIVKDIIEQNNGTLAEDGGIC